MARLTERLSTGSLVRVLAAGRSKWPGDKTAQTLKYDEFSVQSIAELLLYWPGSTQCADIDSKDPIALDAGTPDSYLIPSHRYVVLAPQPVLIFICAVFDWPTARDTKTLKWESQSAVVVEQLTRQYARPAACYDIDANRVSKCDRKECDSDTDAKSIAAIATTAATVIAAATAADTAAAATATAAEIVERGGVALSPEARLVAGHRYVVQCQRPDPEEEAWKEYESFHELAQSEHAAAMRRARREEHSLELQNSWLNILARHPPKLSTNSNSSGDSQTGGGSGKPAIDAESPLLATAAASLPLRYELSASSSSSTGGGGIGIDAIHLTATSDKRLDSSAAGTSGGSSGGKDSGLDDDFRSENEERPLTPHATVFSSALNLANTIIGIGILSVPAAINKLGLLLGIFMLIACAFGSSFGLYLLTLSSDRIGHANPSWFMLGKRTYPRFRYAIDFAICLKCIGVGTSFLLVVGQLLVPAFDGLMDPAPSALLDRRFWIGLSGLLTIPIACLPKMHHLRWSSVIGFGTIAYLLLVVVYEYASDAPSTQLPDKNLVLAKFDARSITAIPTFIFAYTCHQNAFTIYSELKDKTRDKMKAVIAGSVGPSCLLYLFVGILGYLSFGAHVSSDILVDYGRTGGHGSHEMIVNLCRIAMALHVMTCYPLQAHPFRTSFRNMVAEQYPFFRKRTDRRPHILLTAMFVIITFAIAMSVDALGLIFSLIGATGSNLMTYILPGLFYWKLTAGDEKPSAVRYGALAVAILGCFILVLAVTVIILDSAGQLK